MRHSAELAQWLPTQLLDTPVRMAGESVYLRVRADGAELGAYLWHDATPQQLEDALKQGFSSALEFDAGLALDGRGVVLSLWLPSARGWQDAADALENLLNQLARWRAGTAPGGVAPRAPAPRGDRHEQRMRSFLAGGRR
ncbi:hypothetical protein AAKU55_003585 [Oxalobacteraceae bacterium GrIS 1.11]